MKTLSISSSSLQFVFLVIILSCSHSLGQHGPFLQCLDTWGISGSVYTQENPSYSEILYASIENLRFTPPSFPKPFVIVAPKHERDIMGVVRCSKQHGLQIRIRSGGHDFEGLSYTSSDQSSVPFVVLDMFNLNRVVVDVDEQTAWVEPGAILGQLYYEISQKSNTLAFPGGFCSTVAAGGLFSGGGFGQLFRQYGLAADNVIDARMIDANGNVLDRDYMGEDLFWAIRGGGGGSFGVVTAWKVKLVYVPQVVTMFIVNKTLDQNAAQLIHRWQYVAPNLPNNLYTSVRISRVDSGEQAGSKTIQATFDAIFNGGADEFLQLFAQSFPELGATREDCTEMSWVQTALFFNGYDINDSPEVLKNRQPRIERLAYKAKADFVQEPITVSGIEGMWDYLYEAEADNAWVLLIASGGIMNEFSECALPYPFRAGYLYEVQYRASWDEAESETSQRYINWVRRLYDYMTPYVSKNPRGAYINYRDLDIGVNGDESAQIPTWGVQYFKGNIIRLMSVKTRVDPDNFFRHEQSIPTFSRSGDEKMPHLQLPI